MHYSGANSSQLLHLSSTTQHEPEVNAQRPDVGSGLAVYPENSELVVGVVLDQLALVNVPDAKLSLDGRDQWGALVAGASELFNFLFEFVFSIVNGIVEANNANIFFTC